MFGPGAYMGRKDGAQLFPTIQMFGQTSGVRTKAAWQGKDGMGEGHPSKNIDLSLPQLQKSCRG
jgi:hypothetical protein